ncbi:tRNA adenosine(34) deaminase TadA [Micrococcoides hystricis]|uniref:tRNA-specific adenosine deaminase n=1 Tax=Micrococcoides hystricis TaxID=1572761 RepID=A0ABV6PAX3_9MICC
MSDHFSVDEFGPWLELAFEQAGHCAASADVPVGAVVVDRDGQVIGRGYNRREVLGDPTAHAEILALQEASQAVGSWRLDGCTLVVTLEPCVMCAGAISLARIPRLVFSAWEPKTGAVGSLYDVLRDGVLNHQVEVYGGIQEERGKRLLRDFFAQHRDRSN